MTKQSPSQRFRPRFAIFATCSNNTNVRPIRFLAQELVRLFHHDHHPRRLEEERLFEDVVADLWAESDDMGDFRKRMEELGDRLLQAKGEYQKQQVHDNKIFGDRFAPDQ